MKTTHEEFSWPRLIAAIVVAFIVSMAWLGIYCEYVGFVGPYWGNVLVGFFGVFVGSLAFRKQHRVLGSVILLIGGTVLDGMFEDSDDKVYPLSVVWVALGGLAAVVFYLLVRWAEPGASPNDGPPKPLGNADVAGEPHR